MSELATGGLGSSPPDPQSTTAVDAAVAGLKFDPAGLLPAIVQDDSDGTVLMVAWMDAEAVRRTLTTGRTWFWSRSRRRYWQKGETSGHVQHVRSVTADCDGDSILVRVEQVGSACHTGTRSCFTASLPAGPVHRGGDKRSPEPPQPDPEPAGSGS
jgi:phosphoribosyl-AMP cyclohydrolase